MSSLNIDIFSEILEEFWRPDLNIYRYKQIEKFMLSGKEAFEAAIKYFAAVDKIAVFESIIVLHIQQRTIHFSLDHGLLKPILSVLGASFKVLEIYELPVKNNVTDFLQKLIVDGLLKITLHCRLPDAVNAQLKTIASVNEVLIHYDSNIVDLFNFMPVECVTLQMTLHYHEIFAGNIPSYIIFPSVKNLNLKNRFRDNGIVVTPATMPQLLRLFLKMFPNLDSLNIHYYMNEIPWNHFFENMKNCFKELSKIHWEITGEISCSATDEDAYMARVMNKIQNISMIVHDAEDKIEVKKEIQKGLTFRYYMHFREYFIEEENFGE